MEMKKQLFGKGVFAGLTARQWDAVWTLLSAEFLQQNWLTFFADVTAEGSIPGTEPLSKFFQAVKQKISLFRSFWALIVFSSK